MKIWFNFTRYDWWESASDAERWERMTQAEREFMTTTPPSPEHIEFMQAAKARWPDLPPGAAQVALHALQTKGAKAAARYVSAARTRWASGTFKFKMPPRSTAGICKFSVKQRREMKATLVRYRKYVGPAYLASLPGGPL
jgi:hypothetical protein